MSFLVGSIRFRRGVPEILDAFTVEATNGSAPLDKTRQLFKFNSAPIKTEGFRVFQDDGHWLTHIVASSALAEPALTNPSGHMVRPPDLPNMQETSRHGRSPKR